MSWAQDEWKNNLPHAALVKIENYEKTLDHLKKEQQQKNIKVDILEGTLAQQKKTVDEQKFKLGNLQKENHTLTEKWRDSEISKEKVNHFMGYCVKLTLFVFPGQILEILHTNFSVYLFS